MNLSNLIALNSPFDLLKNDILVSSYYDLPVTDRLWLIFNFTKLRLREDDTRFSSTESTSKGDGDSSASVSKTARRRRKISRFFRFLLKNPRYIQQNYLVRFEQTRLD